MTLQTPTHIQEQMVRAYQKGGSLADAAAPFGLSSRACRTALEKLGVPLRKRGEHGAKADELERMARMYARCQNQEEVARHFGVTSIVVSRALRECGVERRIVRTEDAAKAEAVRLYIGGLSLGQTAKKLSISKRSVQLCVREAGVETRDPILASRKYTLNDNYFQEITDEERAWWLGWMASDGCLKGNSTIQLSLAWTDRGHVEKFRTALGATHPIRKEERVFNGTPSGLAAFRVRSFQMFADLQRHGIHPRKTFTVKPWNGPEEWLAHYYRGVFEGDGSIFKAVQHRRGWTIAVAGTLAIVEGFADFVRRQLSIEPGEIRPAGRVFQLKYWRVADVRAVIRLLYDDATCWLERKKATAEEALQYLEPRYTSPSKRIR